MESTGLESGFLSESEAKKMTSPVSEKLRESKVEDDVPFAGEVADGEHHQEQEQGKATAKNSPGEDCELRFDILRQVEFYFSDENLKKDTFMLKHIRKGKDGFVSLKLVLSLSKMKPLCRDLPSLAAFIHEGSKSLVVSEAGTKVRRVEPLPSWLNSVPLRTIVALHVAEEHRERTAITRLFAAHGTIERVRIVLPGNRPPPDIRELANDHPELRAVTGDGGTVTEWMAFIEFADVDSAKKAVREMRPNNKSVHSGQRTIHVVELVKGKNREQPKEGNKEKPKPKPKKGTARLKQRFGADGEDVGGSRPWKTSGSLVHRTMARFFPLPLQLCGAPSSGVHLFPGGRQPLWMSPSVPSPKSPRCPRQKVHYEGERSPWMRRIQQGNGFVDGDGFGATKSRSLVPPGVVRLPRGPDGTYGFHTGYQLSRASPQSIRDSERCE